MMERMATTPFGGARMTARNFALQAEMERRQEFLRAGDGGKTTDKPAGHRTAKAENRGKAEKWQLLRALTEARETYDLSDRSISVLEALTSFHQDRELDGKAPIIVFPSNAELSMRCRGMSPATLRRHLAALVEAGLIFRRDSANGKRFCRRDSKGRVEDAFGFDLAPLALRADEIFSQAETVREQAKKLGRVRLETTLHLRDVAKTLETILRESPAGDWQSFEERLQALSGRVPRNGDVGELQARCEALIRLRAELEHAYLQTLTNEEMSAKDSAFEHHIQNSDTDLSFELEARENSDVTPDDGNDVSIRPSTGITLKEFLRVCPQIVDYARHGVKSWRDVLSTAELVRSMLDISPSAWAKARRVLGDIPAAIVVSAILERAQEIRSPGGYLRDLTQKAERGRFSVHPMLKALRE